MYRGMPFLMQPMEWMEENLRALPDSIDHADIDAMALRRQQKRGLWGRFYPHP